MVRNEEEGGDCSLQGLTSNNYTRGALLSLFWAQRHRLCFCSKSENINSSCMNKEERMRRNKDQSPTATASAKGVLSPDDVCQRPCVRCRGRTRERQRCRGRTRERQARSVTPRLPTQGRTPSLPRTASCPPGSTR